MKIGHYTTTGYFYIGKVEKQQQVVLNTPFGTVSEIWDEDSAPYREDMLPSEVEEIIRDRIKHYTYVSNKKESLEILDAIRANANIYDYVFCIDRAKRLRERAKSLIKGANNLIKYAEELNLTEEEKRIANSE